MPFRKRGNISNSSKHAKKMRLTRSLESSADRQARLESNRVRNALARARESSLECQSRLRAMCTHNSNTRSIENSEERETRLARDRERHTQSRVSETYTQRESRLSSQLSRTEAARSQESTLDRELRLAGDRERHAESRASETYTQRVSRLSSQLSRTEAARSLESTLDREVRLTEDRERHAESRASETYTQRVSRLSSQLSRTEATRSLESTLDRELRLTEDRERHAESRASETYTQRESRLNTQLSRTNAARSLESPEEYEMRLTIDRTQHAISRSMETEEEQEQRLETARQRYQNMRENITALLTQERDRINDIRATQSNEQREIQLQQDRLRRTARRNSTPNATDESIVYDPEEQPWSHKEKSGYFYDILINYANYGNIGTMTEVCQHCQARKWVGETKGMCCESGKVRLSSTQVLPELLRALLNGEHPKSRHFLQNIRAYNSAFQMTSFGAHQISERGFMPTFKVQGQVYHLIGSLLPTGEPKFLQVYFIADINEQANIRSSHIPNLDSGLIRVLQSMLHNVHPYINNFKAALESVRDREHDSYKFVISADKRPSEVHQGRHNAPTANEVAVLLVDQECDKRDIVLHTHDNRLQRISETHRAYDTLQYPLMFCRGEDGYNFAVYNVDPQTGAANYTKKTSALQFYSYQIQLRINNISPLHSFRALFSQYLVDMYAKIETERLIFIRLNQRKLRAESYMHLRDAMRQDSNAENVGTMVILPSSFTGGPRYMHERTQDAFCYVRKYGRPDLFITITTNPKWPEITCELLDGQVSHDRHDLVSRVFHLKLKLLVRLLTKEKVFGAVRCHMHSVEWQKRGLPHAHLLLWLEEKVRPNEIDQIIMAELPNPIVDPGLHSIIKSHMVHGPCGNINPNSPCMKDGKCSKSYPKRFTTETITGENGYPSYRRRSPAEGGYSTQLNIRGQSVEIDNRWVVPYSPVLSRTFETHINVESCSSVESIKYVCKYINKGSDLATFALQGTDRDEVTNYQSGRYISTSEAVWRILSFPIHDRYPTVMHLDVHLENGQRIYFNPDNVADRIENPRQTTLLAFFKLCELDQFAKTLKYDEVPSYYTYDKRNGRFNRRRRGLAVEAFPGIYKDSALGRVYTVHPNNGECYFLRLLLHIMQGPTSFQALRTFEDVEYPTYRAACVARHLLDGDQHWDDTLEEASVSDCPSRLRHLFAVMLVFCGLSEPVVLWDKFKNYLSEDFMRASRFETGDVTEGIGERVLNNCLHALQDLVISIGGKAINNYGLPSPQELNNQDLGNREYTSELNYNRDAMTTIVNESLSSFTSEQLEVYNTVLQSIEFNQGKMFFLDAPGGTGKTFIITGILSEVRRQGKIAVAVASSGIAATLLPGGKTAHTMFKIPIDLESSEMPVCVVSRDSDKGRVLKDCSVIVWDECTMANKKAVEAVNRTLQDIRKNQKPMGGVTVLFSGDFRQTLPVVTRGTRADEVNASLKRSILWSQIITLHLTRNMRAWLGGYARAQEFSDYLLKIGEGTLRTDDESLVVLPETLGRVIHSLEDMIHLVYGELRQIPYKENSWICERVILTPRNDQASAINETILSHIEGNEIVYNSINTVVDQDDATHYPVEFLNSLNSSGLPAHTIKLKVGIPIMLLRNLTPPKLCNGTRLKVVSLKQNIIEAEILTGCGVGETVFIPRIPLIPHHYPFQFKRVQFPISVCFAMTINKSQGQTLRAAGIDLRTNCFSHGQLYVACSRVISPDSLYILAPGDKTKNVVYREVL